MKKSVCFKCGANLVSPFEQYWKICKKCEAEGRKAMKVGGGERGEEGDKSKRYCLG